MRFMACHTSLYNGVVDIGPGIILFVMTCKAGFIAFSLHEFRIITIMGIMTSRTIAPFHRLVD